MINEGEYSILCDRLRSMLKEIHESGVDLSNDEVYHYDSMSLSYFLQELQKVRIKQNEDLIRKYNVLFQKHRKLLNEKSSIGKGNIQNDCD